MSGTGAVRAGGGRSCRRSPRRWRRPRPAAGRGDRLVHPSGRPRRGPDRRHQEPGRAADRRARRRTWCVANQEENRRAGPGRAARGRDRRVRHRRPHPRRRVRARCRPDARAPAGWTGRPGWTRRSGAWAALPVPARRRRAVIPIWRRPWMAVGRDTFTGAVLARLGVDNVLAGDPRALPALRPRRASRARSGRAARRAVPVHRRRRAGGVPRRTRSVLVSGRLLTWYGPSLVEAARTLPTALAS